VARPPGAYSVAQNSAKMHKNTSFLHTKKNPKICSGGDTAPSPDFFPMGRGHPSPYATPQVPPLQLDTGYATVQDVIRFSSFNIHVLIASTTATGQVDHCLLLLRHCMHSLGVFLLLCQPIFFSVHVFATVASKLSTVSK